MMEPLGKRFGNYYILRLLGEGSFADVYLAEHEHLGTQAAIKLLHPRLTNRAESGEFLTEARTVANLRHPHIIRVLDFGVQDGTPFLVLDYAPNGTLRQLFPKHRAQPPETILPYARQIAAALQYAHDRKLIHRDVKPANILLGRDNEVLLSDFGLALITHHTGSLSLSGTGTSNSNVAVAGTPDYMAPEQFSGKPCFASDQYALAVMVYEWLCGTPPYSGSNFFEIAFQHVQTLPRPPRQIVPTLSVAIEEVVLKALSKEPWQRYARVQDFAGALEQAIMAAPQPQPFVMPASIPARSEPTTPTQAPVALAPAPIPDPVSSVQAPTGPHPGISRRDVLRKGLIWGGLVTAGGAAIALIIDEIALHSSHAVPGSGSQATFQPSSHKTTPTPTATAPPAPTILEEDVFRRGNQQLWGTASNGLTWQGDANNASNAQVFSINNNTGQIDTSQIPITGTAPTYKSFLGASYTNAAVSITGSVSSFTKPTYLAAMLRWNSQQDSGYKAVLDGSTLSIQMRGKGAIASQSFNTRTGSTYTLKFQAVGTTLQVKAWRAGEAEPTLWTLTHKDTTYASGLVGIRAQLAANTRITISSFRVTAPSQ